MMFGVVLLEVSSSVDRYPLICTCFVCTATEASLSSTKELSKKKVKSDQKSRTCVPEFKKKKIPFKLTVAVKQGT